jgi:hypothetical protein
MTTAVTLIQNGIIRRLGLSRRFQNYQGVGNTCNVKKLSDYEFYISLEKKLKEEIQGYQQSELLNW